MYGKEGGLKATYPRLGTYETLSNKNPMELDARSDSKGEGTKGRRISLRLCSGFWEGSSVTQFSHTRWISSDSSLSILPGKKP